MKMLLAFVIAFTLAGCSSFGPGKPAVAATDTAPAVAAQSGLQVKLTEDLTAAIERTKKATDPVAPLRLACWEFLLASVPDVPDLSLPDRGAPSNGLFDGFEIAAEAAEGAHAIADYQIPDEFRVNLLRACGPVKAAAENLLLQLNLRFARVAGRVGLIAK